MNRAGFVTVLRFDAQRRQAPTFARSRLRRNWRSADEFAATVHRSHAQPHDARRLRPPVRLNALRSRFPLLKDRPGAPYLPAGKARLQSVRLCPHHRIMGIDMRNASFWVRSSLVRGIQRCMVCTRLPLPDPQVAREQPADRGARRSRPAASTSGWRLPRPSPNARAATSRH